MICIEVEQKFCTSDLNKVQSKLIEMGFDAKKSVKFMDWYFDVPNQWTLCTQDCWLRFRHPSHAPNLGSWQLKRGRRILDASSSSSASTVYEEMEGDDAIDVVESLLAGRRKDSADCAPNDQTEPILEMDGYEVPQIPRIGNYGMQPFARIETIRSSWNVDITNHSYNDITVDIDGTDYGYMVGEVETIVSSDDKIKSAREKVQKVITEITGEECSGSSPALGKLETYLMEKRPEVHEACVSSGTMKG